MGCDLKYKRQEFDKERKEEMNAKWFRNQNKPHTNTNTNMKRRLNEEGVLHSFSYLARINKIAENN